MNSLKNKMHMFEPFLLPEGRKDNWEGSTGFLFFLSEKQCVITAV